MKNEHEENYNLEIFKDKKIRKQLYNNEWYFSIVDVVEILTESNRPRKYWEDLKRKIEKENGNFEMSEKIGHLKMLAKDGKMRFTDCANRETIFRLIQSIPSPNAEPFKLWFARLAEERVQEINNPEITIKRAKDIYLKKGYSEEWTNARVRSTAIRNELTDEWKYRGVEVSDYAILTDDISKGTFGITTR